MRGSLGRLVKTIARTDRDHRHRRQSPSNAVSRAIVARSVLGAAVDSGLSAVDDPRLYRPHPTQINGGCGTGRAVRAVLRSDCLGRRRS